MSTVSSATTVTSTSSTAAASATTTTTISTSASANRSETSKKETKQKYSAFNINSLYKGKSLENPKTSVVVAKHGLQTVGKVGAGRRVPPPANIPSLKSSNTSNTNSNLTTSNSGSSNSVNIVPSGAQGWAASKDDESISKEKNPPCIKPLTNDTLPLSSSTPPVNDFFAPSQTMPPHATTATSQRNDKSRSSYPNRDAPQYGVEMGTGFSRSRPTSDPYFAQEFPQLSSGDNSLDSAVKPAKDTPISSNNNSLTRHSQSSSVMKDQNFGTKIEPAGSTSRSKNYGHVGGDRGLEDDEREFNNTSSNVPLPTNEKSAFDSSTSVSNNQSYQINNNNNNNNNNTRKNRNSPNNTNSHLSSSSSSSSSNLASQSANFFLPDPIAGSMNANNSNQQSSNFKSRNSSKYQTSSSSHPKSSYNNNQYGGRSSNYSNNRSSRNPKKQEQIQFSLDIPTIISDKELKSLDQILDKECDWALEQEIDYSAKIEFSDDDEDDNIILGLKEKPSKPVQDVKKSSDSFERKDFHEINHPPPARSDRDCDASRSMNAPELGPKPHPYHDNDVRPSDSQNPCNRSSYYGRKSDSVFEFSRKDAELDPKMRRGEFYSSSRSQQLQRGGQSGGYNSYRHPPPNVPPPSLSHQTQPLSVQPIPPSVRSSQNQLSNSGVRKSSSGGPPGAVEDENWRPKRMQDDISSAVIRGRQMREDLDDPLPPKSSIMPPPSIKENDGRNMGRDNSYRMINDYGSRGQGGNNSYSYSQPYNLPPRLQRQVEMFRQNNPNTGGYSDNPRNRSNQDSGGVNVGGSRDYDRHRRTPPDYPDNMRSSRNKPYQSDQSSNWRSSKPQSSSNVADQRRDSVDIHSDSLYGSKNFDSASVETQSTIRKTSADNSVAKSNVEFNSSQHRVHTPPIEPSSKETTSTSQDTPVVPVQQLTCNKEKVANERASEDNLDGSLSSKPVNNQTSSTNNSANSMSPSKPVAIEEHRFDQNVLKNNPPLRNNDTRNSSGYRNYDNDQRRSAQVGRYEREQRGRDRGNNNSKHHMQPVLSGHGIEHSRNTTNLRRENFRSSGPSETSMPVSSSNYSYSNYQQAPLAKSASNDRVQPTDRDQYEREPIKKLNDYESEPKMERSDIAQNDFQRSRVDSNISNSSNDRTSNASTPAATTSPSPQQPTHAAATLKQQPLHPTVPGTTTANIRASVRNSYGPPVTGKTAFGDSIPSHGIKSQQSAPENDASVRSSLSPSNQTSSSTANVQMKQQQTQNNQHRSSDRNRSQSTASQQQQKNQRSNQNTGNRYRNNSTSSAGSTNVKLRKSSTVGALSSNNNNHESDQNNEEWETASENSDMLLDRTNANHQNHKMPSSKTNPTSTVNHNMNVQESTDNKLADDRHVYPSAKQHNQSESSNYNNSNSNKRHNNRSNQDQYSTSRHQSGNATGGGGYGSTVVHNYRGSSRNSSNRSSNNSYRGSGGSGGGVPASKGHQYQDGHPRQGHANNSYQHGQRSHAKQNHDVIVNQMSKMTLNDPKSVDIAVMDAKASKNRNKKSSQNQPSSNQNRRSSIADDDVYSEGEDGYPPSDLKRRNRSSSSTSNKSKKKEQISKSKNRNRSGSGNNSSNAPNRSSGGGQTKTSENKSSSDLPKVENEQNSASTSHQTSSNKTHEKSNENKQKSVSVIDPKATQGGVESKSEHSNTCTVSQTGAKPTPPLGPLSSGSFDQHDSGIESGDQPPSTSSTSTSQRSSPNNDDNKVVVSNAGSGSSKLITTGSASAGVKCTPSATTEQAHSAPGTNKHQAQPKKADNSFSMAKMSDGDSSTNPGSRKIVRTLIYENTKLKQENKVLSQIDESVTSSASASKAVVGSSTSSAHHHHHSTVNEEVNMKISSLKKVWDSTPNEPSSNERKNSLLSGSLNSPVDKNFADKSKSSNATSIGPKSSTSASNSSAAYPSGLKQSVAFNANLGGQMLTSSPPIDNLRSSIVPGTTYQTMGNAAAGAFHQNVVQTPTSPPTLTQLYSNPMAQQNIAAQFQYGQMDSMAPFAAASSNQNPLHQVISHYMPPTAHGSNQQNPASFPNQHAAMNSVAALSINPQSAQHIAVANQANLFMTQIAQSQSLTNDQFNKFSFVANQNSVLTNNLIKSQYVSNQSANGQLNSQHMQQGVNATMGPPQQSVGTWPGSSLVQQQVSSQQHYLSQALAANHLTSHFVPNSLTAMIPPSTTGSTQQAVVAGNQFRQHQQAGLQNMNRTHQPMDNNSQNNAALRSFLQSNMLNHVVASAPDMHHHQNAMNHHQVSGHQFINDPNSASQRSQQQHGMHHNHHRQFSQPNAPANPGPALNQAPANWSTHQQQQLQAAAAAQQQMFMNQPSKFMNSPLMQMFSQQIAMGNNNPASAMGSQLNSRTSPLNNSIPGGGSATGLGGGGNNSSSNYPNPIQRPNNVSSSSSSGKNNNINVSSQGNINRNNNNGGSSGKNFSNHSQNKAHNSQRSSTANYSNSSRSGSTPSPATGSMQPPAPTANSSSSGGKSSSSATLTSSNDTSSNSGNTSTGSSSNTSATTTTAANTNQNVNKS